MNYGGFMKKVLIIDGNPIIGLSIEEMTELLSSALQSNLEFSYLPVIEQKEEYPVHGFIYNGVFYEWNGKDETVNTIRNFTLWDIIGNKLYNPIPGCAMTAMRRGKLHMNIEGKWLRANIIRLHNEFEKDSGYVR